MRRQSMEPDPGSLYGSGFCGLAGEVRGMC